MNTKKIAFIFPGQGSQYPGMGRDLFDKYEPARRIFNKACEVVGFDLKEKVFNGAEEELQKTEIAQPAIFTVSMACLAVLINKGINPVMVAGHSLGEYTAVAAAGALEFSECLALVIKRGEFIREASEKNPGGMAAIIGLEATRVKEVCSRVNAQIGGNSSAVEAVNFNSPIQVVVSGTAGGCEKAVEIAKELGAKRAAVLKVSGPFHHSQFMNPAREGLAEELENHEIKDARIPLVANYTGNQVTSGKDIREALVNQINSPVLWEDSVKRMIAEGVNVFIEVGPGKVLTGLLRRISKDVTGLNIEDENSFKKALGILNEG